MVRGQIQSLLKMRGTAAQGTPALPALAPAVRCGPAQDSATMTPGSTTASRSDRSVVAAQPPRAQRAANSR